MKKKITLWLIGVLFLLLTACSSQSQNSEQNVGESQIADGTDATAAAQVEFAVQTRIAINRATQQALIGLINDTTPGAESAELLPTPTRIDPSLFPTIPAGVTSVTVETDAYCRTGPSMAFDVVDMVFAGQSVEVLGVGPNDAYYVIRSPRGGECWIWAHDANLSDKAASLPVMTPPAAPAVAIQTGGDVIRTSTDFSWSGKWIPAAPGGQSFLDWYNAAAGDCDTCAKYDSFEIEITEDKGYLDIQMVEHISWNDGSSVMGVTYGMARLSPDGAMAVGSYMFTEVTKNGQKEAYPWEGIPTIMWYQNGNPDQFVGYFDQWVSCATREGAKIPVPCALP